ncbi:MAG: DUF4349 domain-containing protein [Lachnospiraceae bacterium]|nr:DUF4349 domain-containing protein [Lachnospiraceae bacterium]
MRGLKIFGKKKVTAILLTVCMMAVLTGCGASAMADQAMTEAVTNGSYSSYAVEEEYVVEESLMDSGAFVTGSTDMKEAPAEGGETADVAVSDRKLIKTVDMNVETQEFDTLLATIDSQVKALGGYIENMNTYNGSAYYSYREIRNANLTIRIPKNELDTFLNTVTGISNVIRRSDRVEDVTLAYVDMESHRDALRTEQTRLLELLERAESIEDIITIEQRLSQVRYQLESMESQLRTYDNQVDYSTVYLNIEEVEIYTPVEEETVWERISEGFMNNLRRIGDGFVEFGIGFVINLPYLVVWAVIITVFVLMLCAVIKGFNRTGKKNEKKAPQAADKQEDGAQIK